VSDLLDLARIENREAQFKPVSLGEIAEEVIDLARSQLEARRVSVRYGATRSPIEADVDRGQVERALSNLLSNAVKFTPPKGEVSITLSVDHDQAVVRVSDTGPGIPPEERPHVFERFFQGEQGRAMGGGSGLGLAIVARVARAHGGEVRVDSSPGRGATFELRLPLVRSRTRPEA
jgi:signal transduction histidine kinase